MQQGPRYFRGLVQDQVSVAIVVADDGDQHIAASQPYRGIVVQRQRSGSKTNHSGLILAGFDTGNRGEGRDDCRENTRAERLRILDPLLHQRTQLSGVAVQFPHLNQELARVSVDADTEQLVVRQYFRLDGQDPRRSDVLQAQCHFCGQGGWRLCLVQVPCGAEFNVGTSPDRFDNLLADLPRELARGATANQTRIWYGEYSHEAAAERH